MDNYLALEPLLIARLKAEVPDFRAVLGMADLAAIMESSQPTPAAHVVYRGGRFSGKGAFQVSQPWWVVVAVRNVRDTVGGSAAREDAGPLLAKVLKALSGWHPQPELKPLVPVNAPPPGFSVGYGYFPLVFEFSFFTEGTSLCALN